MSRRRGLFLFCPGLLLTYPWTNSLLSTYLCTNFLLFKYLVIQISILRFSPFIAELEVNAMKQSKLTYSPSPSASNGCLSSPTRAMIASSPARTADVSAFTPSSPSRTPSFAIICSPTTSPSPTAQSPTYLRPPSPYQQAKRSLSPQPLGNNKRLALSPPQSSSVIKAAGPGGSKRNHSGLLVNGVQYVRRVDPQHRVEGGHRVVDIDQDIFPALSQTPSGGSVRGEL